MIIRREFLKRAAFAALATILPEIPLPRKQEDDPLPPGTYTGQVVSAESNPQLKVYTLGFRVTEEMIEDDVYGDYITTKHLEDLRELTLRFHAVV